MAKEQVISKKFRGLNVAQVNDYLEQLNKQHFNDVANLKQKIELSFKEKDRLYQILIDRQMERERLNKAKELLDLALIRAKEAVVIFKGKAKEEAEELLLYARQQNENYEWKQLSIEQEISATKKQVESLLTDMKKLFQESKLDKAKHLEDNVQNKVVGKISPAGSYKKTFIKNIEQKTGDAPQETGGTMEKEEEKMWLADEKKMTADGSVVAAKIQNVEKDEPALEQMKSIDNLSGGLPSGGRSFWDDNYDTSGAIIPPVNTSFTISDKPAAEIKTVINEVATTHEESIKAPQYQAPPSPAVSTAKTLAENVRTDAPDDSFGRSPAISAEINNIRHKYIVGKIAGESLIANDGSVIIAQNQIITAEIVARAEAEGRLPELIVNMILPGMDT